MRAVIDEAHLRPDVFYAVSISSGLELARFVGNCQVGSSFVLIDNIARRDHTVDNVTVKPGKISKVVFEIGDQYEKVPRIRH